MEFLPFFLILLATVLFSNAFQRFHLPWVLALIVSGMVVGPHGLHLVTLNPTIEFMGSIGLIFLMFMAGLETELSSFREFGKGIFLIAFTNGIFPALVGVGVGMFFGYPLIASLLLGIIFMSSSVAVIIPALEENGLIKKRLGKSIVASAIIVDVLSLVLLSVLLQNVQPITTMPLPSFYVIVAIVLVAFGYALPKIRNMLCKRLKENDLFESEVRIIFLMLMGTVITFSLLGLNPIIAGFFSGLILSDTVKSERLIEKLRTISYGIFIPVFFVIVGLNTNLNVLFDSQSALFLAFVVIFGSMASKYISGTFGARLAGFDKQSSRIVGIATVPQLSTTLAVVYTAAELGILDDKLVVSMVALSIFSTIVAPFALRRVKVGIFT